MQRAARQRAARQDSRFSRQRLRRPAPARDKGLWDTVQPILDKALAELGDIEDSRREEAQALIEESKAEHKKRAAAWAEEKRAAAAAAEEKKCADAAATEKKKLADAAAAEQKKRAEFTAKMKEAEGHLANKRWAEAKAGYEKAKGIWPESPTEGRRRRVTARRRRRARTVQRRGGRGAWEVERRRL